MILRKAPLCPCEQDLVLEVLPLDPDPGARFEDVLSLLAGSGRQGQGTKVSCVPHLV